MFTEVPLLDRFEAAAKAGFKAVEFGNPYEASAADIAARLKANGLTLALFNTTAGDAGQGRARARRACRAREGLRRRLETALDYCAATGCKLIHVMAGLRIRARAARPSSPTSRRRRARPPATASTS